MYLWFNYFHVACNSVDLACSDHRSLHEIAQCVLSSAAFWHLALRVTGSPAASDLYYTVTGINRFPT